MCRFLDDNMQFEKRRALMTSGALGEVRTGQLTGRSLSPVVL